MPAPRPRVPSAAGRPPGGGGVSSTTGWHRSVPSLATGDGCRTRSTGHFPRTSLRPERGHLTSRRGSPRTAAAIGTVRSYFPSTPWLFTEKRVFWRPSGEARDAPDGSRRQGRDRPQTPEGVRGTPAFLSPRQEGDATC